MKICFWLTAYFALGGTKRVVTLIANELVKRHDITIMCHQSRHKEDRSMYGLDPAVKIDYVNLYEFVDLRQMNAENIHRKLIREINDKTGFYNTDSRKEKLAEAIFPLESRKRYANYVNAQGYDVVIAAGRMGLWLAMMSPFLKCKTVGWQHSNFDGYLHVKKILFWKKEALLQEYLPRLDAYVVLTRYDQQDYLEKLNIQSVVMTNPRTFVSDEKSNVMAKKFLMVTRFEYVKGLDLAIKAFQKFAESDQEWEFDIVGNGTLFNQVNKEINDLGLSERIHLLGYSNQVKDYYLNSSILLFPSRWEGWGMVVVEANEFGVPVIAFNVRPMDLTIKNRETGLLVEPFDTDKYAEAMLELAHNDELRKNMSAKAIEQNKQYDIAKIGLNWEELLGGLVSGR